MKEETGSFFFSYHFSLGGGGGGGGGGRGCWVILGCKIFLSRFID